jgi:hypothetical protein
VDFGSGYTSSMSQRTPTKNLPQLAVAVVLIYTWMGLQLFREALGIPRKRYLKRSPPPRNPEHVIDIREVEGEMGG